MKEEKEEFSLKVAFSKFLIYLVAIVVLFLIISAIVSGGSSDSNSSTGSKSKNTITFNKLEITFDSDYTFEECTNCVDTDLNGEYVKIGADVKNIGSTENSIAPFTVTCYNTRNEVTNSILNEDENAKHLAPGETGKVYFEIKYSGSGKYKIVFELFTEKVTYEFDVKKVEE